MVVTVTFAGSTQRFQWPTMLLAWLDRPSGRNCYYRFAYLLRIIAFVAITRYSNSVGRYGSLLVVIYCSHHTQVDVVQYTLNDSNI
jgi:hypothetical protein